MSERSIRDESSSAAHKRHGTAPSQDEEGPLPLASATAAASSSLAHQVSSNPKMPFGLPFRAKRNSHDDGMQHHCTQHRGFTTLRQTFVDCLQRIAMRLRSIHDESSSAAHKRHGTAPRDDESPLPSESSSAAASSSLAHQVSSNPKMPLDLIACLILPFVTDRGTWNSVCLASKELWLAGKKMTPPWPNKAFYMMKHVGKLAFSPSGSHLAFAATTATENPAYVIHVWDRWGKEILLVSAISRVEYSSDGEYLAS
jgi:hypothetical protein